ncbi:hypothetical protein LWI29_005662 [Acer saccharum]|uniref:Uncharacterized protein n=1 Tax=Acer saccharum TaxID=4024 RepID=A0AA39SEN4_ACESA|nr:hypothetical protein LWI29_005662 [Acer saccharum]
MVSVFTGGGRNGSEGNVEDVELVLTVVDESASLLKGERGNLGVDLLDLLGGLDGGDRVEVGGAVGEGGGERVGREFEGMFRVGIGHDKGSIDATTFKLHKRENSIGYLRSNTIDIGSRVETQLQKINADRETMQAPRESKGIGRG